MRLWPLLKLSLGFFGCVSVQVWQRTPRAYLLQVKAKPAIRSPARGEGIDDP